MILVDFSGIAMAAILGPQLSKTGAPELDESFVRHTVLNSLRQIRTRFVAKYGELVLCIDDNQYWRREVFPHYKAARKKTREQMGLDWKVIFHHLSTILEELKDNFPYKVIHVPRAEADDVIGALCEEKGSLGLRTSSDENILIVSNDKDFLQLQKYANVEQYAPVKRKMLLTNNPERTLREHIMTGDRGDGIPNFLSPDNSLVVEGVRQKKLMTDKLSRWAEQQPEDFCDEGMLRGYKRNQLLIDLSQIPSDIKKNIVDSFEKATPPDRSKLFNYFIKHKLRVLTESLGEF